LIDVKLSRAAASCCCDCDYMLIFVRIIDWILRLDNRVGAGLPLLMSLTASSVEFLSVSDLVGNHALAVEKIIGLYIDKKFNC